LISLGLIGVGGRVEPVLYSKDIKIYVGSIREKAWLTGRLTMSSAQEARRLSATSQAGPSSQPATRSVPWSANNTRLSPLTSFSLFLSLGP